MRSPLSVLGWWRTSRSSQGTVSAQVGKGRGQSQPRTLRCSTAPAHLKHLLFLRHNPLSHRPLSQQPLTHICSPATTGGLLAVSTSAPAAFRRCDASWRPRGGISWATPTSVRCGLKVEVFVLPGPTAVTACGPNPFGIQERPENLRLSGPPAKRQTTSPPNLDAGCPVPFDRVWDDRRSARFRDPPGCQPHAISRQLLACQALSISRSRSDLPHEQG